jgi:hypothetical protein
MKLVSLRRRIVESERLLARRLDHRLSEASHILLGEKGEDL